MPKRQPLTKIQAQHFEAIRPLFSRNYGPTLREIGALLGISEPGAHKLCASLVEKHWLKRGRKFSQRTLELVED